MRKLLRAALMAALLAPAAGAALGPPPTPSGTAWLLVDGRTGEVLAERNADAARPMASTTKMMTALVALESGEPDEVVTVVPAAGGVGESSAGLRPGQRITMRHLIRALMIGSGNDAAIAIAYAVAGSEAEFVTRMNDKARDMGLTTTRFANPHGLDEPGHRSSPRDLLVLGRAVMKDPFLRKIVGERRTSIPTPDGSGRVQLESENDLLSIMPEADGVKTGHTDGAGYVLVAHATSGTLGRDFYAVVMGEPDRVTRAADSKALLEWAFANYSRPVVIPRGRTVVDLGVQGMPGATVALAPPAPVAATVRVGKPVSMRVVAPSMATAPMQKGQRVGRVEVLQDGAVVARSALIARGPVGSPGFGDSLKSAFSGIGSVFS
ncbi:MAG: D-alanyl-D-alanine carboxypeptidase [Actinobacteria bacterium]|nr:D-alanyl-D-alanine carboxypeptidase [Actinomycetota bacterium]MBM3697515.1 D-alanyl-D-alanine carboxypeptidase [Actinomycetota bacterium]